MPDPIQLTSVHDLDLDSFKDLEKGTLKDGSIKLGKSTYTVKFIDGKVSVSRNFHFFNLFRANAKNELRDAFNAKMYDSLRSKNETLYTNTFNALEKIFKGDGSKSMMLFGMGDWTGVNKQGIDAVKKFKQVQKNDNPNLPNPVQSSKIETLIILAGLSQSKLKDNLIDSLNQLDSPTFVDDCVNQIEHNANDYSHTIDQALMRPWFEFLQRNSNRVNIFRMLNQAIEDSQNMKLSKKDLVGWAAMMRKHGIEKTLCSFLQKNMKENSQVTHGMVQYLRPYIDYYNLFVGPESLMDPSRFVESDPVNKVDINQIQEGILKDCIINAVQREVMKLGLEFCREQNIPVLFQWTDSEGKTVSSKELKTQLWSPDYVKDKRPKFSPILHTAMRHAQRLQNKPGMKLKLVQVNGISPD